MSFSIKVWDFPIRLFHWLLVALIIFLWCSAAIADDLMAWHLSAGKLLLALLLFRVTWGFCGSQTARFTHFVRPPMQALYYLTDLIKSKPDNTIGHNPAGAYMVLMMMIVLLVQIISGLCNSDDIFFEGSLFQYLDEKTANWMAVIHYYNFYILLALIAIHLLAIVSYYLKGNNLIAPMISGCKKVQKNITQPNFVNSLWALIIFMLVTLLVFFGLE
jgi:cytochrome b